MKTPRWEISPRFSTEIDYESGRKNVRQVGPRQFQFLEVIDLHSACGETSGNKYAVEVTYVDLDSVPEKEQQEVRQAYEWEGMAIETAEAQVRALAECMDSYGTHATIYQDGGSNRRKLMADAYRAANEALDPAHLDALLDATANQIGTTQREVMSGNLLAGLARPTEENAIVRKMYAACTQTCPECEGSGGLPAVDASDPEVPCHICEGSGKVTQTLGGLIPSPTAGTPTPGETP